MNSTIEMDGEFSVVATETGPRCGSCKLRHANVISIRACHELRADEIENAKNEAYAEQALLRQYENRASGW